MNRRERRALKYGHDPVAMLLASKGRWSSKPPFPADLGRMETDENDDSKGKENGDGHG